MNVISTEKKSYTDFSKTEILMIFFDDKFCIRHRSLVDVLHLFVLLGICASQCSKNRLFCCLQSTWCDKSLVFCIINHCNLHCFRVQDTKILIFFPLTLLF